MGNIQSSWEWECPSCKTINSTHETFCTKCGTHKNGAKAEESQPKLKPIITQNNNEKKLSKIYNDPVKRRLDSIRAIKSSASKLATLCEVLYTITLVAAIIESVGTFIGMLVGFWGISKGVAFFGAIIGTAIVVGIFALALKIIEWFTDFYKAVESYQDN